MPKANPKLGRRGAQARVAKALLAADPFTRSDLDDQGTYAELRPNAEVIRVLKLISSGAYVRNAQSILAGIRTQLEWPTPKPPQKVEHQGGISITWVSQAIIVRGSAPTATSHQFAYIPTGSLTSGGSAVKSRKRVYTASGGIQAGGSAVSLSQGGGRFVYTGSGGIVTGGGSTWNRTRVYTASRGSIVTGGAASVLASLRTIYNYTPSGRIDLGGSAPVSVKHNSPPTGRAVMGGAASVNSSSQPLRPSPTATPPADESQPLDRRLIDPRMLP